MDLSAVVCHEGRTAALAQATSVFPLNRPVVDGDHVHVLRGCAWDQRGIPQSEADASDLVRRMGRLLAREGGLFADGDEWSGLFTLCTLTRDAVYVASDPSGIYPLYCWARPGRVLASSHGRVLARLVSAPADLRGVVQMAAFGYTIGERTLYQGIRQLPAGASARLDRRTGETEVLDHPSLYGPVAEGRSLDTVADDIWTEYLEGVHQMTTVPGRAGMLMSGGFDTRLVALGLTSAGRDLVALTIGDDDNHEVGVARRVANLSGAEWTHRTAEPDLDLLEEHSADMLAHAESLCFPTCWFGGKDLQSRGATTLSTGYGGETLLGGQGGTQFLGATDRLHRLLGVLQRGTRGAPVERQPLTSRDIAPLLAIMERYHRDELQRLGNRVPPGLRDEVRAAAKEIGQELEAELERTLTSGPTALEQVAERFWLEHHVRKHFGRQELTLDAVLPLLLPTLSTKLLIDLSVVDPHLKVDHRVYLRMVRRNFGQYAKIPTSNVPVPLTLPSPALWMARTARALWDDRQTALQMRTRGAKGKRFGWSNYEIWARESSLFDQLPRMIAPWLIDPAWLSRKLTKQQAWEERIYSGQEHLIFATISGLVDP